jgi:hypothetical protein
MSGTVPAVQCLSPALLVEYGSRTCAFCIPGCTTSCASLPAALLVECSARFWFLHVWYSTSCAMSVRPRCSSSVVLGSVLHPWVHYQLRFSFRTGASAHKGYRVAVTAFFLYIFSG